MTLCLYCNVRQGRTRDHVVSRALARKLQLRGVALPARLLATVPACSLCNGHKGTRRLVPPSWAPYVKELNGLIGGQKFKTWDGSTLKARTLCLYCNKTISTRYGPEPPTCFRCRVPVHEGCRTAHMGRCRKARVVAA